MTDEEIAKEIGFEICSFPPDTDPCECCKEPNLQLYFRRTDYWSMDGEYYCIGCIKNEYEMNQMELAKLWP